MPDRPSFVLGTGLVGSFLGASGGFTAAAPRPGASPAVPVLLANGRRTLWAPLRRPMTAEPVLVATRCHQTPWTALPADSLAVQNGLGQPIPVAVCFMAVDRHGDGTIACTGPRPRVVTGPMASCWQPVLDSWREAGLSVEVVADIRAAQWEKAILNATVGPLCRATGLGIRAVWHDPDLGALARSAIHEGMAIATACGIGVDADLPRRAAAFFDAISVHRPSVVSDDGELPWILGPILEGARRNRLPCPALAAIAGRVAGAA